MRRAALALALVALAPTASRAQAGKPPAQAAPPPAAASGAQGPAAAAQGRYLEGFGKTPAQEATLVEVSRVIEAYERESLEFQEDIRRHLTRTYQTRRDGLSGSYERQITQLEIQERRERLDAIAQFEEFLRRYPNDPQYTPDVMFRLAELYFERSTDDHLLAMKDFEEKARVASESGAAYPAEPTVDFAQSIALYQRLIAGFPNYRFNDGAYYLLGYCLEKQDQMPGALAQYQALIARFPKSRFTTEAWVRIGEYYFDADPAQVQDPLMKAAEAYEAAIRDTSHPLYDKALYKLGWVYYRVDRFGDATARFMTLADFYEAQARAKGEETVGGDLREEALQYIAISLIDDKFSGTPGAQQVYAQLEQKPYGADVWRRLGDLYFDQTRHDDAIAAYRRVLAREPLRADAPELQEKIALAYERDRRLDESFAEGEKLAEQYGPGTAWHAHHANDPDVLAAAQEKAERALYGAALFHHQQALVYKEEARTDPSRAEAARAGFQTAAVAYAKYLERFPRSKNAYEMAYYRAECLYNSLEFRQAALAYQQVRDDGSDSRYRTEAALSAVFAWQRVREADVRDGKVPDLKPLRSAERPEGETIALVPLIESEQHLIAASDRFVAQEPKDARTPGLAYKAAELFYAHNDFAEARRRFEAIIGTWPENEVARFSTNLVVESYLVDGDWKSVEEVSARLAQNTHVAGKDSELNRELTRFKLAGRFKLAEAHFAAGEYEAAATKYVALVDEDPKHEFADKALNNAAVSYEKVRRFDSALKLYERIVRDHPKSELADDALFRVALNAEQSYDLDKAVKSYGKLVSDYPASGDREAALYNTARLLEAQQRYPEAARAFLRYADVYPDSEDAPKNQYRAALIYEKQKDWRGAIRAFDEFGQKFAMRPAHTELVVDAKKRTGEAWQKLNRPREAREAWTDAAREFERRKLNPETHVLAAEAAAFSSFQLAEEQLQGFDKLKISGGGKKLVSSLNAKKAALKVAADSYTQVFKYKRLEWILAAQYRRGYLLQRYATTLVDTPVPPEVKRLGDDEVIAYQELVANEALQFEEQAAVAYQQTLQVARENRVANAWTRRTLESLNRLKPKEFPVLKEPKELLSTDSVWPTGLVGSLAGPPAPAPAARVAEERP